MFGRRRRAEARISTTSRAADAAKKCSRLHARSREINVRKLSAGVRATLGGDDRCERSGDDPQAGLRDSDVRQGLHLRLQRFDRHRADACHQCATRDRKSAMSSSRIPPSLARYSEARGESTDGRDETRNSRAAAVARAVSRHRPKRRPFSKVVWENPNGFASARLTAAKDAPVDAPHRLGDALAGSSWLRGSLPSYAFTVSQWPLRIERLAAHSCGGSHGLTATRGFPCSLLPPRLAPENQHIGSIPPPQSGVKMGAMSQ